MLPPEKSLKPTLDAASSNLEWFGELNQVDFEIQMYERIVQRCPNYVLVLRCLGELLSRQGLYQRSVEVDQQLVALCPQDEVARYNLACSLARFGQTELAIEHLHQAVEIGYSDFEHMEVDPDLDSLRCHPGYLELLDRYTL